MSRMQFFLRNIISVLLKVSHSEKFSDFLLWPVSKRLFSNYSEVVEIKKDLFMEVYGDMEDMVNKSLLFKTKHEELTWEPVTARFVQILAKESKCVVNAGAHIGYYPLIIHNANPECQVFAFEPNPANYERLKGNLLLNSTQNVEVICGAIGEKDTERKMYFDFGQSSFFESNRKHVGMGKISVVTLDTFFKNKTILPDLMVLDAEGYEPNILMGAQDIISKTKPNIILELNPNALQTAHFSIEHLCNYLGKWGYSLFVIDDNYSHSFGKKKFEHIILRPYKAEMVAGVSFVNAFATMNPNHFGAYIYEH